MSFCAECYIWFYVDSFIICKMVEKSDFGLNVCAAFINKTTIICELYRNRAAKRRQKFRRNLLRKVQRNFRYYKGNIRATLEMHINCFMVKKGKSVWMKKRSQHWWNNIFNSKNFDEMIENFRMDKETFNYICNKLSPELAPRLLQVRAPLSVDKKVAIAIYKLASCAENRVVANQFGVHKSSVRKSLNQFCQAVVKVLLKEEIQMPNAQEAIQIIEVFEERTGLPQVLGAIDGTHIPVMPKSEGYRDYINRKGWSSLVMQAVVDCNYLFRDITCQHPGCTHDAAVLRDSCLYKNSSRLQLPTKLINATEVSAYIISDPAYPLLPWLIKPYSGARSEEEDSFNVYLSRARIVVENAFGRLKGRWRILQKRIDMDVSSIPTVVATCCVLHNILEKRKTPYYSTWNENVVLADSLYIQPTHRENSSTISGDEKRDFLKNFMSYNFPLLQSMHV